MTPKFDAVFNIVVGIEGSYSDNPSDPGNWTNGQVGSGELKGTKYGISAAVYPNLDIKDLTIDQAKAIYEERYWNVVHGDDLPPMLSLCVFDCAVNNGPDTAIRLLQRLVGVAEDGDFGPITMAAINQINAQDVLYKVAQFLRYRTDLYISFNNHTFQDGWIDRLFLIALQAYTIPG